MATLKGAINNVKTYGLFNTIKGSFQDPGGILSYGSQTAGGQITPTQLGQQGGGDVLGGIKNKILGYAGDPASKASAPAPAPAPGAPTGVLSGSPAGSTYGGATIPQFQPTAVGGQTYNNQNDYNTAALNQFTKTQAGQEDLAQRGQVFDQTFQGTRYNDIGQYTNAVRSAAQTEHAKNVSQIEKAYKSGLLTFDERQQAIDSSRQSVKQQSDDLLRTYTQSKDQIGQDRSSALGSQASFFSAASPDAYQSQQETLAGKTNAAADQSLGNLEEQKKGNDLAIGQTIQGIDQAQSQNDRARGDFTDSYTTSVDQANKGLTSTLDAASNQQNGYNANQSLANDTRQFNADASLGAFKDQLANNVLTLQQQQDTAKKAAAVSGSAKTSQYDPVSLTKAINSYYIDALSLYNDPAKARAATEQYGTAQTGLKKEELTPFINFVQGQNQVAGK